MDWTQACRENCTLKAETFRIRGCAEQAPSDDLLPLVHLTEAPADARRLNWALG